MECQSRHTTPLRDSAAQEYRESARCECKFERQTREGERSRNFGVLCRMFSTHSADSTRTRAQLPLDYEQRPDPPLYASASKIADEADCTPPTFGWASRATTAASIAPAFTARCRLALATVSEPLVTSRTALQPVSCSTAACRCACIAATTASMAPASAARCLRARPSACSAPAHALARLHSASQPCHCTRSA